MKSKRWQDLYGIFCVDANDEILETDMKYIYECMYEMSSDGIKKFLQNLKSSSVPKETNHNGSQNLLSFHNLEANMNLKKPHISLKPKINSMSNSFTNVSDVKNTLKIEKILRSKIELNELTCRRGVLTNTNAAAVQKTRQDALIFKYPGNYVTLPRKTENPAELYSQTFLNTNQPDSNGVYPSMQPQHCLHLTKEDPYYKQIQINHSYLPYKLNQSSTIANQKHDSTTLFDASNFEINEMGDIVLCSAEVSLKRKRLTH